MSNQLQVSGEAKIRAIQGPVVANSGVITALDGDASEYVRGDGTLADFPTSTGGGSSVSYYLNTSVSQGTIGGVAYKQLSKTPISGAGTDVTISANGYIASYITDANDPALLEVPAGNFNCEFYFSVNSNAHNPYVYAEVYKYDGTTFTLLGSNVSIPQYLNNGTTLSPYYFAIAVSTAVLTVTDRISIRIYVNVDGRTVTLHTENNHLCQVVTTFSKGLISLNNLTRQNQFFGTGTSGTDFAISSATATHTFNLPVASAANTGKLSSTDWSTFNGKVPYTGAIANVDLGGNDLSGYYINGTQLTAKKVGSTGGALFIETGSGYVVGGVSGIAMASGSANNLSLFFIDATATNTKNAILNFGSLTNNTNRTYTLPDASGTLPLLESTQTFTGANTFSGLSSFTFSSGTRMDYGPYLTKGSVPTVFSGTTTNIYSDATTNNIVIRDNSSIAKLEFNNSTQTFTFPSASGTIALTSNLSSYVPYTGATTDVDLGVNSYIGQNLFIKSAVNNTPWVTNYLKLGYIKQSTTLTFTLGVDTGNVHSLIFTSGNSYAYTFPNTNGTIALTSDLSAYVTLATTQTISGAKTFGSSVSINTGGQASLSILSSSGNSALILGYVNSVLKGTIDISATEFKLISAIDNILKFQSSTNFRASLIFSSTADYSYTYPAATGTLALTSNLSSYVPYTGATTEVDLGINNLLGGSLYANGNNTFQGALVFNQYANDLDIGGTDQTIIYSIGSNKIGFSFGQVSTTPKTFRFDATSLTAGTTRSYTMPDASGTIALTSNLSAYLPLTGGTLTGALSGTSATFSVNQNSTITNSFINTNTTNNSSRTILNVTAGNATLQIQAIHSDNIYITPSTATDTYLGYNNILRLLANGNATFSGSVAIGSSSAPSYTLDVSGTIRATGSIYGDVGFRTKSLNGYLLKNDADSANLGGLVRRSYWAGGAALDTQIFAETGYGIYLNVNGSSSTGMLINSAGNVGIGASSPAARLTVANPSGGETIRMIGGDTIGDNFMTFYNTAGTRKGYIGYGYSNNDYLEIFQEANDIIIISTNSLERLRITNGGELQVAYSGGAGYIRSQATYTNTSANVPNMYIGSAYDMGRGTASSMRYKENIIDWDGNGLNTILALKPKTFTYKEEYYKHPERVILGLIAEEVAETCKYLADYENEDGSGEVENVRYAYIVVPLIKAIQELEARVKELEAK